MRHLFPLALCALTLTACHTTPDYDATGIFEATTVTVSSETTGKILSLDISEGDSVKEGQQVALIAHLEAQLSTFGKSRSSISDNTAALQYQSEQIAEQIEKSKIKSPLTGTVLVKYAEPGEFATPGKPLYKAADLDNIYLRAYFTADQLPDLKIGQKVTVIADFGGDEQFDYPGTISWIAQESEFTPKSIQTRDSRANLVYAVKISVKNDGRLKLGQYGEVRL